MSDKGLNSNDALEESTVTSASVTLSGIRRLKEAPGALDIRDYRTDPGNSDERGLKIRGQRPGVEHQNITVRCVAGAVRMNASGAENPRYVHRRNRSTTYASTIR